MDFETAHEAWLHKHLKDRRGESKRMLEEGYGHAQKLFAEKVWWPVFGHFACLVPEYEVRSFGNGQRFLDFAYVRGNVRICIEIDGFGPHWRDISRRQFADQWNRQNDLILSGWLVCRFAYDALIEYPRRCQQVVQQFLGFTAAGMDSLVERDRLSPLEREIMRLLVNQGLEYITPTLVSNEFHINIKTAYRALHSLLEKQIIVPLDPDKRRIHRYRYNQPT